MAQGRPDRRPGRALSGAEGDQLFLLVVVQANAVVDACLGATAAEVAGQQVVVELADDDRRGLGGRRRTPLAEAVVTAVGARQPVGATEQVDGTGLAVVGGEDRRPGPRRCRQAVYTPATVWVKEGQPTISPRSGFKPIVALLGKLRTGSSGSAMTALISPVTRRRRPATRSSVSDRRG